MDDGTRLEGEGGESSIERRGNVLSMARVELVEDAEYGDLITGPAPAVRGTRFPPLTEIKVEVSCYDGAGRHWSSLNEYLVSAEGIFDTAHTAAVGEGYYGIANEGPLYSMVCREEGAHTFAIKGLRELEYQIRCTEAGREISNHTVRRYFERPDKPPLRARVFLHHDGVISDIADTVALLESYGIEVNPHLNLHALPESGTLPLDLGPGTDDVPNFLVGSGLASATSLELAMAYKGFQAVILFSGGGLRFDPTAGSEPSEGADGRDYIRLDHSSLQPKAEGILITRKLYADAVADKANRDRGRIEVEKIPCPIYMFSGADDQIWPASAFSELVAQRRKMKTCPFPTYHRTFEGVGHDLGPSLGLPTLPTTERTIEHPDTGFRLLLGGKPGRQARARRECWDALLNIIDGNPPE